MNTEVICANGYILYPTYGGRGWRRPDEALAATAVAQPDPTPQTASREPGGEPSS